MIKTKTNIEINWIIIFVDNNIVKSLIIIVREINDHTKYGHSAII